MSDSTTDGPFAETKEQFGGYYVIEAKDLTHKKEMRLDEVHVAGSS